jgi:murein lipoprotein
MKKRLLLVSMMLGIAMSVTGCATSRDLAKVQAQEQVIDAKADQALKDAQAAKAAADAATLKADAAATRAEKATQAAEERERIADEKAAKADAVFQKSMRK